MHCRRAERANNRGLPYSARPDVALLGSSRGTRLGRSAAKRLQGEIAQTKAFDVVVLLFVLVEVTFFVANELLK